MTAPEPPRIFIAYSTKDGVEMAARLRRELEAIGLSVWQDLVALEGGRDWWSQIEAALKSKVLQHFVLIVTAGALASSIVRREIRLARQEGKSFLPIKGPGLGHTAELPRWIGQIFDLTLPEHRVNFIRTLEGPSTAKRVPMMAPEPPADFVPRPTEFEALKTQLLDPNTRDSVAITAALRGAGGYGKTTLARALAHDEDIQDAYFDGILWVELGERGGARVLPLISDLITLIEGQSRAIGTKEGARTALAEALGDRRILLVVDDVWRRTDLEAFLHGGRHTTRLITTRFDKELPETSTRQPVDAMQTKEARALLAKGLPEGPARTHGEELDALAKKLHEWAQLLKLANGFLRDRVMKFRQPLSAAISEAEKRLVAKGLPAFDLPKATRDDETDFARRHKSIAAAVGLNLDLLEPEKRERFSELGVFPEDADIPVGIIARLWTERGKPDEFVTTDLLAEFYDLSLLLNLDLDRRTIRFHDTMRHFLQDEAKWKGILAGQHKRLIEAIREIGDDSVLVVRGEETLDAELHYFYNYLPLHLAEASERDKLANLLLDPAWLQAKLAVTSSPQNLVADYDQYGRSSIHVLIGQTLRLTSGICMRNQSQLLPQLLGRISRDAHPQAAAFLDKVRQLIQQPAILKQHHSLTPPESDASRIAGHSGWIRALTLLPDGKLASCSSDSTILLWDLDSGLETLRLAGHVGEVMALAQLPDNHLASGSSDDTIRLWDLASGAEIGRLESRSGGIRALAALPGGLLAAGCSDNAIRIWDPTTGSEILRLVGHRGWVRTLALLPNGRLASGSSDNTIQIWDPRNGREILRLHGHSGEIRGLAPLPNGQLISGSSDGTIRLWDLDRGIETLKLVGHAGGIRALAPLPDGRLASGSNDRSIRLWDLTTGAETRKLVGHTGGVMDLVLLPDGRLASGSTDGTVRLWELTGGRETRRFAGDNRVIRTLAYLPNEQLAYGSSDSVIRLLDTTNGTETTKLTGHAGSIRVLVSLPDGRLASGSYDNSIRLWDVLSGIESLRLNGHSGEVRALVPLQYERLASGSFDNTIRVWDLVSGTEILRLLGHEAGIRALALLSDGRLASGSLDGTIRFWDPSSGAQIQALSDRGGSVRALQPLQDGRLVSGSTDGMIRIWDPASSATPLRLEGHRGEVMDLASLPNGRLASACTDNTVRLWDLASGREIAQLEFDGALLCLTALTDGRLVAADALGRLHWLEILG